MSRFSCFADLWGNKIYYTELQTELINAETSFYLKGDVFHLEPLICQDAVVPQSLSQFWRGFFDSGVWFFLLDFIDLLWKNYIESCEICQTAAGCDCSSWYFMGKKWSLTALLWSRGSESKIKAYSTVPARHGPCTVGEE